MQLHGQVRREKAQAETHQSKEVPVSFSHTHTKKRFHISFCYPSPGVDPNPISLGDRWMAYADQRMLPIHRLKKNN